MGLVPTAHTNFKTTPINNNNNLITMQDCSYTVGQEFLTYSLMTIADCSIRVYNMFSICLALDAGIIFGKSFLQS